MTGKRYKCYFENNAINAKSNSLRLRTLVIGGALALFMLSSFFAA
jgi:hypothetical protein